MRVRLIEAHIFVSVFEAAATLVHGRHDVKV